MFLSYPPLPESAQGLSALDECHVKEDVFAFHAEFPMMEDKNRHGDVQISGLSLSSGFSGGFEPSARLRARIEKLASWRVDPSSIEFSRDDRGYHGGHGTVSRGRKVNKVSNNLPTVMGPYPDFLPKAFRVKEEESTKVAVKKMRVGDNMDLERVWGLAIREAEFLAELSHPNIVDFEGFVEDAPRGIIWLVFPLAKLGNLKDFIGREKWEIPERISLIRDVSQGLEHLHSRNPPICHADLKSLNVLVDVDVRDYIGKWGQIIAKITDFGSARRLSQRDPTTQTSHIESQAALAPPLNPAFSDSTQTITLTGNKYTLRWAAPELLSEDQLSLVSDIWALGWIVYEVMTGSLPFENIKSDAAVVQCVLDGAVPSLGDYAHLVLIHELCSLMHMCWKIHPSERPTAEFCLKSLKEMPICPPQMSPASRRVRSQDLLIQLGHMYQSRRDYTKAFDIFVEALKQAEDRPYDMFSRLRDLAQLAKLQKKYSKTIQLYDMVWKIYRGGWGGRLDGLGDAFCDLAELYRLRNESDEAIELHPDGRECQGLERTFDALCTIAEAQRYEGKYERAIQCYTEALKTNIDPRGGNGKVKGLLGLSDTHRLQGQYDKATQLYVEALKTSTDLGDEKCRAKAIWGLAQVHRLRTDPSSSDQASDTRTDSDEQKSRVETMWARADAHLHGGECDMAIPLYLEALRIWTDFLVGKAIDHPSGPRTDSALNEQALDTRTHPDDQESRAEALWASADKHQRQGGHITAAGLYAKALQIWLDLDNRESRADTLWTLGDMHRRLGKYEKAIPAFAEALQIWLDGVARESGADTLWVRGDIYWYRGERSRAASVYSQALQL